MEPGSADHELITLTTRLSRYSISVDQWSTCCGSVVYLLWSTCCGSVVYLLWSICCVKAKKHVSAYSIIQEIKGGERE